MKIQIIFLVVGILLLTSCANEAIVSLPPTTQGEITKPNTLYINVKSIPDSIAYFNVTNVNPSPYIVGVYPI